MARLVFISALSTLTVTLTLALGCSEEENGGPSIDTLPSAFAGAACEAVESCLGDAFDLIFPGEDCRTNTEHAVKDLVDSIRPSLQAGRIDYEGSALDECLAAVRGAGCDYPDTLEGSACLAALDGTVALGSACDFSAECAGKAYCKSSGACPGTCTAGEPDGGPCTTDSDCSSGLACGSTQKACYLPAGSGDPCEGGVAPECEPGLFCIGADENLTRAGTCRVLTEVLSAGSGATCDPVAGPMCATGLHCRIDAVAPAISARCVARVAAGSACGAAFPDMCPPDQYCAIPTDQLAGTCSDRPAAGAACGAGPFGGDPSICAPNLRCDGGTCRERQEVGGSCTDDDVCLTEHCLARKCALAGACQ